VKKKQKAPKLRHRPHWRSHAWRSPNP